jgi:DNA primase
LRLISRPAPGTTSALTTPPASTVDRSTPNSLAAARSVQSRISTPEFADTTTIDLDPGDGVSFSDVVTLARHIKTELDRFGLRGALKTSGSRGLHIALPLPSRTDFKTAPQILRVR